MYLYMYNLYTLNIRTLFIPRWTSCISQKLALNASVAKGRKGISFEGQMSFGQAFLLDVQRQKLGILKRRLRVREKVAKIIEYLNHSQPFVSQESDLCLQNYCRQTLKPSNGVLNLFFPPNSEQSLVQTHPQLLHPTPLRSFFCPSTASWRIIPSTSWARGQPLNSRTSSR